MTDGDLSHAFRRSRVLIQHIPREIGIQLPGLGEVHADRRARACTAAVPTNDASRLRILPWENRLPAMRSYGRRVGCGDRAALVVTSDRHTLRCQGDPVMYAASYSFNSLLQP